MSFSTFNSFIRFNANQPSNLLVGTVTGTYEIPTDPVYNIYKFTTSGSITFTGRGGSFSYVIVGGGGGGSGGCSFKENNIYYQGYGGGGGGGQVITGSQTFADPFQLTITVGAGGTGTAPDTSNYYALNQAGNGFSSTLVSTGNMINNPKYITPVSLEDNSYNKYTVLTEDSTIVDDWVVYGTHIVRTAIPQTIYTNGVSHPTATRGLILKPDGNNAINTTIYAKQYLQLPAGVFTLTYDSIVRSNSTYDFTTGGTKATMTVWWAGTLVESYIPTNTTFATKTNTITNTTYTEGYLEFRQTLLRANQQPTITLTNLSLTFAYTATGGNGGTALDGGESGGTGFLGGLSAFDISGGGGGGASDFNTGSNGYNTGNTRNGGNGGDGTTVVANTQTFLLGGGGGGGGGYNPTTTLYGSSSGGVGGGGGFASNTANSGTANTGGGGAGGKNTSGTPNGGSGVVIVYWKK